jgi:NAD(P)H-nitrite reductase large subunit
MTGSNLENVLVYRSMDDLKKVQRIINKDSKVVIIGSSFIGMEAASGIKKDI